MSCKEYKKQRKFCANFLKKNKKEHFANLDVNFMSDNKRFYQIVKPFFSNKVEAKLVENNEMIDEEIEVAKLFNDYFVNIVKLPQEIASLKWKQLLQSTGIIIF